MPKKDVFDIQGRIVVITGGLGQLGRQYCSELLERDARVVILDVPDEPSVPCSSAPTAQSVFRGTAGNSKARASLDLVP